MLEGIGLTAQQEQVYLGMLAQSAPSTSDIIARHADRPPAEIAQTVTDLVALGLATRLAGPPEHYVAVAPDVAIEALVRACVADARRARQAVPALMEQFWIGHESAACSEFVETIACERESRQRWRQLWQGTSDQLRAFDCRSNVTDLLGRDGAEPSNVADPLGRDRVGRNRAAAGVSVRMIYSQEVLEMPGRWADVETGIAVGEHARVHPNLPVTLTLFDDFAAALSASRDPAAPAPMIIIHRSPLLDALSALFESFWQRAVPLSINRHVQVVDGKEEPLLRLLAAGLGDDAIQRALGVSASTVHRRVHELMQRLGARTRFQAGYQLARTQRSARRAPSALPADGPRTAHG